MGASSNPFSIDESSDVRAWVVRGGREGEAVAHNLGENVVTLGWAGWLTAADDVGSADRDSLDRIFDQRFSEKHSETRRRRARQRMGETSMRLSAG